MNISVAMCTYNGAPFLREQLDSILNQSVPPCELVVCDDASTDGTPALLDEFRERCPFPVRLSVNSATVGVCRNFERAITACSGDIIAPADQDDIWEPEKLATIMEALHDHPDCGYVFSNAELVDPHGAPLGMDLWRSIGFDAGQRRRFASAEQLEMMLKSCSIVYGMTMAFRSRFRPLLLPIESLLHTACTHDTWISLMLSASGAFGVALPACLVRYRQHDRQLAGGGSGPPSLADRMRKRQDRDDIELALADSLLRMAERLGELCQGEAAAARGRQQLDDKARHLQARVAIRRSPLPLRLRLASREALSGRYGRFSSSLQSVFKDIVPG